MQDVPLLLVTKLAGHVSTQPPLYSNLLDLQPSHLKVVELHIAQNYVHAIHKPPEGILSCEH